MANTRDPGLLAKIYGMFGKGKSLGPNLFGGKGAGLKPGAFTKGLHNVWDTRLLGGPKISTVGNIGQGVTYGLQAVQGLSDNVKTDDALGDIKKDIRASMVSNPMYDMYLSAEDERTLRDMESGKGSNSWAGAAEGAMKGIPDTLLATLTGALLGGGIPGAIIGATGSLANNAIEGYGNASEEQYTKLQGVYDRLRQAEDEYKAMKRPRGLSSAGLSSRYYNQLY